MQPGCRADAWIRSAARASTIVAAVACAGERPAPPVAARRADAPRRERLAEVSAWPLAAAPFVAYGHSAGEFVASVRVHPAYVDLYRGLVAGTHWPAGMSVAVFHERRGAGGAGSVYAMTRLEGGAWEYVVARPDGTLEARGGLALCARCHAEARADALFGVPTPPQESTPGEPRSPDNRPEP